MNVPLVLRGLDPPGGGTCEHLSLRHPMGVISKTLALCQLSAGEILNHSG